jgi:hypothetical protein
VIYRNKIAEDRRVMHLYAVTCTAHLD